MSSTLSDAQPVVEKINSMTKFATKTTDDEQSAVAAKVVIPAPIPAPSHMPNLPFIRRNLCNTLQGHIHLIQDPHTKQPLIIKQTLKKLIQLSIGHNGNKLNENFIEEMRILSYLSSLPDSADQGICTIFNNYKWSDQHSHYYAMKYCPTDLFGYVRKQFTHFNTNPAMQEIFAANKSQNIPYQPWINIVQRIFRKIVKSVHYLHSKGIAHRDLSLENVMLANLSLTDIDTQLIDFGVAYDSGQSSKEWKSDAIVGKVRYMSPEVAAKGVEYDCRSADIWSLGVLLYSMLTGTAPYTKPVIIQDFKDKNSINNGDLVLTYLLNGKMDLVLDKQSKRWMVSDSALDLMNRIFTLENKRIKMSEIMSHSFVASLNELSEVKKNNIN